LGAILRGAWVVDAIGDGARASVQPCAVTRVLPCLDARE
jgi:hypothetical protein